MRDIPKSVGAPRRLPPEGGRWDKQQAGRIEEEWGEGRTPRPNGGATIVEKGAEKTEQKEHDGTSRKGVLTRI